MRHNGIGSGIPAELRDAGFDDVTEIGHGGFGVVYRCAQPRWTGRWPSRC